MLFNKTDRFDAEFTPGDTAVFAFPQLVRHHDGGAERAFYAFERCRCGWDYPATIGGRNGLHEVELLAMVQRFMDSERRNGRLAGKPPGNIADNQDKDPENKGWSI